MTIPSRCGWALAAFTVLFGVERASAQDLGAPGAMQRETRFLQGLRERGYNDLALEYLERLRAAPDTPPAMKIVLEFEQGRSLLEEAAQLEDLDRRNELLEQARASLDAFTQANPNHELAPEALVAMARLLLERGQTAMLMVGEATTDNQKKTRLNEARASYSEARKAYDRAIKPLRDKYTSYKTFLEDSPQKASRDRAHTALMDAELQRALVDYQDAQTYEPKASERAKLLDAARLQFKGLYDSYREWLAGYFAHMWEGKCYEEKGEYGPAMAIYNELVDSRDPTLAPLKRKVEYFRILVEAKRGEHPIAVDDAARWLKTYPTAHRSDEGVGVRFQLAKSILAQLPDLGEADKAVATRRATDLLNEVVRYYSTFKAEAIELLKQYRPAATLRANQIAAMPYDDASGQADAAISTHEWDRALALLRQAVRRAETVNDQEKINLSRLRMAVCWYEAGNYYAAAALGEHLARNYPKWNQSPKAAELGLASWTNAYNNYGKIEQVSDLERLIDLAKLCAATWPGTETGDAGLLTLGEIALGRGDYASAAESFESIREKSPRYFDALVKAGDAHWRLGLTYRDQNKESEAAEEAKTAEAHMKKALAGRIAAKTPPADPGYITNVNALAEIQRANGKLKEALAMLGPVAKTLGDGPLQGEPARLRQALLTIQLRAHIANGQADAAITDMAALEKAGGQGASLTQLYYELGRGLKREMDVLAKKIDSASTARLAQTRKAYAQFLQALAKSQAGQTYDSLMFAGESLLALNQAKEAGELFDRVLSTYQSNPEFQKQPNSADRLLRTRLRRAESLRKQKKFPEAQGALEEVIKLSPRQLEPMMEQGYLYEDWATVDPAHWTEAYNYWKRLAGQLERGRPRRIEYYDCQYHAALALQGLNQKSQAAQILRGVMTLSPKVGNAEMKSKYETLLSRLTR